MNALRSRRELTSEIPISDTNLDGGSGQVSPFLGNFLHRLSHSFLAENQVNEQQIKGYELGPEKVHRPAYEQDRK